MYVVRNVFTTKPGKARELVAKFQAARPHLEADGRHGLRILTDAVAGFWTVVVESEVEDLTEFLGQARGGMRSTAAAEAMEGYMDLVEGGYREVFVVE